MKQKAGWKRYVAMFMAFVLVLGSIVGTGTLSAEAAAGKTIRSLKVMQAGKNVTKKTVKMKAGASKKLTVKAKTSLAKKNITFLSSNKKVVAVNKNGKLTAKKSGSARITVTVSKKGFKAKKTWVKISVTKGAAEPSDADQSQEPEAPADSSDVADDASGSTPLPTETPAADVTAAPTETPAADVTAVPAETPATDMTAAPTETPGATETPAEVPDVTAAPTETPGATEAPTASPDATAAPTQEPDATGTQAPDMTAAPTETPDATLTPAPSEPDGGNNTGKILVAYFSWSGTSERIAQNIIAQTGADSFRIERETPYSDDYTTVAYGEAKDEADNNARPPIKAPLDSVAAYDKIILCYPIWWHTAPMTVGTFLESYDLTGKTIYPGSQSASMDTSQYQESVAFIKACARGAVVDDGLFTKDNAAIQSYVENAVLGN